MARAAGEWEEAAENVGKNTVRTEAWADQNTPQTLAMKDTMVNVLWKAIAHIDT